MAHLPRHKRRAIRRRRFLRESGQALGAAAVLGVALRPGEGLAASRKPTWHPQSSGFNGEKQLLVRMGQEADGGSHAVLTGLEPRLWTLCAGKNSETDLAAILAEEESLAPRAARQQVERFLRRMYRGGFLVPDGESPENFAAHEVECRPGLAEEVCPTPTD